MSISRLLVTPGCDHFKASRVIYTAVCLVQIVPFLQWAYEATEKHPLFLSICPELPRLSEPAAEGIETQTSQALEVQQAASAEAEAGSQIAPRTPRLQCKGDAL